MKIVTIIGARPQFIKAAAVSRQLRKKHNEKIIHTGQHYDNNMSDIFFKELSIPLPDYCLNVGSNTHAKQTAEMLVGIEDILIKEKPNAIMVYGDTNSTLAGALAASKLLIPIIHIEAGLRSYNMKMPEEQNRILTDHLSSFLFCPTNTAVANLKKEGIINNVYNVGDVMCDAVKFYIQQINKKTHKYFFDHIIGLFDGNNIKPLIKWYLATIHRAENTDSIYKIENILHAFEQFDEKVIFPVHPRTKYFVKELNEIHHYKNIIFTEPVGYLEMLFLIKNAIKVITDSGGLQKEAYILDTPVITIRDQTEWTETLIGNYNILCKPTSEDILYKVFQTKISKEPRTHFYGNGDASIKISDILFFSTL